jgi:hypothetical protein
MDWKGGLTTFYEACRDICPGIDGVVHNSLQPKIKIFEVEPGHPQERDLALPPGACNEPHANEGISSAFAEGAEWKSTPGVI